MRGDDVVRARRTIAVMLVVAAGCQPSPPSRSSPTLVDVQSIPYPITIDPIGRAWQQSTDYTIVRELDGVVVPVAPAPPSASGEEPGVISSLRVLADGTVWGSVYSRGIVRWNGSSWEDLDLEARYPNFFIWSQQILAVAPDGDAWVIFRAENREDPDDDIWRLCSLSHSQPCEALPPGAAVVTFAVTSDTVWVLRLGGSVGGGDERVLYRPIAGGTWMEHPIRGCRDMWALLDGVLVEAMDEESVRRHELLQGSRSTLLWESDGTVDFATVVGRSSAPGELWRIQVASQRSGGSCSASGWDISCSGGTLHWIQYVVDGWDGGAFREVAHRTFRGDDDYPHEPTVLPRAGRLWLVDPLSPRSWTTP
jgi:hypothetical protein